MAFKPIYFDLTKATPEIKEDKTNFTYRRFKLQHVKHDREEIFLFKFKTMIIVL